MTSARVRAGAQTGALISVVLLLGAVPAGAVTQQGSGLSAGCQRITAERVTCTYTNPTASPIVVNVPDGATSATMSVRGGAGGPGVVTSPAPSGSAGSAGGAGGFARATISVDPARNLEVRVGGAGQPGADGGAGGVGGGPGGRGSSGDLFGLLTVRGGGGGGGSEVRVAGTNPATDNPLIAAGGGGGGGSSFPLLGPSAGPGPGGAGGGAEGVAAPGITLGVGTIAGGGEGGTQTTGGAAGSLLPAVPFPIVGAPGTRGAGGDASTFSLAPLFTGTGAGGGGGGYFGGGGGSIFSGGGGGSGFGPAGTTFDSGPNASGAFSAAALPDGEVVIEFVAPATETGGQNSGPGTPVPCGVTNLAVSDRTPTTPLGC
jgi:hypothetical protein